MDFWIDEDHLQRQYDFSQRTFGPGKRLEGVLEHIGKELAEIRETPDDATEWADLIILAFDGALRQDITPRQILDAVFAKQIINENRKWPDYRNFSQDQAITHVKPEGQSND